MQETTVLFKNAIAEFNVGIKNPITIKTDGNPRNTTVKDANGNLIEGVTKVTLVIDAELGFSTASLEFICTAPAAEVKE